MAKCMECGGECQHYFCKVCVTEARPEEVDYLVVEGYEVKKKKISMMRRLTRRQTQDVFERFLDD